MGYGKKLVVLLVLLLGSYVLWWSRQNDTNIAGLDRIVLYGNADIREVELSFKDSERIAHMWVQEGNSVSRGDLLADLETERMVYERDRVRAIVEMKKQVLKRLETGSRPQEIRKAQADVEAAQAELADARRTYERVRDLVKKGHASPQELDNTDASSKTAAAHLKAAREALGLVLEGPRAEDIAAARADLEGYQAELGLAEQKLTDARLLAPNDGVIRDRILEPGDMASPERPVFTLAITSPLWIRAYLDEPLLGRVKPGMAAYVTTDSFPGKSYPGWVGYISPTAEFTPKSVETGEVRTHLVYQIRVYVCNPEGELRLGMPATVTISLINNHAPVQNGQRCSGE